jgi:hypothetical protein
LEVRHEVITAKAASSAGRRGRAGRIVAVVHCGMARGGAAETGGVADG